MLSDAGGSPCRPCEKPAQAAGVSRRTALRRAAIAGGAISVALPVIRSITAPSVAQAAVSGQCVNPDSCTSNADCCNGSVCNSNGSCYSSCVGPGGICHTDGPASGKCCVGRSCVCSSDAGSSFCRAAG